MKILRAQQNREADAFTIQNEPIPSIDLMERASLACFNHICNIVDKDQTIVIVAGNGNNGGDGLAIARLLSISDYSVDIFCTDGDKSQDCSSNLARIKDHPSIRIIELSELSKYDVIIDALFGTGLTRPVEGSFAEIINVINSCQAFKISIDIPSGLMAEDNRQNNGAIIKADLTLTFQSPKLAFFLRENAPYVSEFRVLDIGLDQGFIKSLPSKFHYSDEINLHLHKRDKHAYKNQFGHVCLIAGSEHMMGAAILSAKACLKAGVGLLTMSIPETRANAAFSSIPEAMQIYREAETFTEKANIIAIGPGLGTCHQSKSLVLACLQSGKQLVLDADALNLIAATNLVHQIPTGSIITPHVGEFDRLFGTHNSDYDRLLHQLELAKSYNLVIVLKGAYTSIATPNGHVCFNSTGNPYMATGGAGDVLTGIIASFLAQAYSPEEAAVNGVYIHGRAGDLAHQQNYIITASDIADYIPKAIRSSI